MDKNEIIALLDSLQINYTYKHYSNIKGKLQKCKDNQEEQFLLECILKYIDYHKKFKIKNFQQLTEAWNSYLLFVRNNNKFFTSQSKFESTILEESIFRMFYHHMKDKIKTGSIKAYSNMFFAPSNFEDFKKNTNFKFNVKDQDFAIYKDISVNIDDCSKIVSVPVIAIECKTYLDKTMLEGSVATADKIKNGNPYCKFYIVTETYDVGTDVDIKSTRLDQIYILNKTRRRDNKNRVIQQDVLERLYQDVSNHLTYNWSDIENNITQKGIIL